MKLFAANLIISVVVCVELGWAGEKRTLTLGVQDFPEYLPYSEVKDGRYSGFNRELFDLFASKKGYVLSYKAYPLKRLYHEFLQGRVDLKYPDDPQWTADLKRGRKIKYSDAVVAYVDGVLVLPKNRGRGLEQLKRLGMVAGFTPVAYLDRIERGSVIVSESYSLKGLLVQALKNRVDGAYFNIAVGRYYLDHFVLEPGDLLFDPGLPHSRSHRRLSSIRRPEVIADFNDFLMKQRSAIDELKKRHRVEDVATAPER